jgi:thiosulfate reductase cytochrome b subunit
MAGLGKSLIIFGLIIIVFGIIITCAGKIPWLGRIPGDIQIKRDNFTFYFPLATCILVSVIVSLLLWLLKR